MMIEVVKSKIHRVTVTGADLNYVGSISIDEDLMDAANLIENEKVQVLNINNGERLDTYVIRGTRGSGEISLNGPAARKVSRETSSSLYRMQAWNLRLPNSSGLRFSSRILLPIHSFPESVEKQDTTCCQVPFLPLPGHPAADICIP
jgi:hypothetical protein